MSTSMQSSLNITPCKNDYALTIVCSCSRSLLTSLLLSVDGAVARLWWSTVSKMACISL